MRSRDWGTVSELIRAFLSISIPFRAVSGRDRIAPFFQTPIGMQEEIFIRAKYLQNLSPSQKRAQYELILSTLNGHTTVVAVWARMCKNTAEILCDGGGCDVSGSGRVI